MTKSFSVRGTRWLRAAGWLCAGLLLLALALPAQAENVAEAWRSPGSPTFLYPWSVSVNPTDGSCWVADYGNNQVVHLAANGTQLWRSAGSPTFNYPWSVSVNSTDGSCWVADTYNNQVVHLASDGTQLWRGGSFSRPWSVSVNSKDGSCWVADFEHSQIVHLAEDGTELWRSSGSVNFSFPWSVSVDATDGSCWVADTYDNQVVHLASDGTQLARVSGFGGPFAVSANPSDDSCWVADTGNSQVAHVGRDGTVLWRSAVGVFSHPFGVSVNPVDGSCWATDNWHNQLVHLAEDGTELWRGGTFKGPSGVSVDPNDDSCWVTDYYDDQIVRLVPVTFADVTPSYWAYNQIEACSHTGIVSGYSDGTYRPSDPVARDQMAVYISRALAGGDAKVPSGPATASFPDVPTDYWAYKYVEYAKSRNIVTGYPDGTYQPSTPVDREQMAIYIARAIANPTGDAGLASYTPPTTPSFSDVPASSDSYKYIEYCKSKGVVTGYPDGSYQPATVVTRDQMAVYVARAFALSP